eukprot:m.17948 g.17948  ORF g.17948 m.17948 type:complete len:341 (+) comp11342_c0_seq3:281-1303(+)
MRSKNRTKVGKKSLRTRKRLAGKHAQAPQKEVVHSSDVASAASTVSYTDAQRILVVGDGDFSFSRGLAAHRNTGVNLTCTAYDTKQEIYAKYGDKGLRCIQAVEDRGGRVFFGVDARHLRKTLEAGGAERFSFDRIIFNFPHTGQQMTHQNRAMMRGFFASAKPLCASTSAQVHVTLKLKFPYTSWDVRGCAETEGYVLIDTLNFNASHFPGYRHRTTRSDALHAGVTDKDQPHCKTFILRPTAEPAIENKNLQGWGIVRSASAQPDVCGDNTGLHFKSSLDVALLVSGVGSRTASTPDKHCTQPVKERWRTTQDSAGKSNTRHVVGKAGKRGRRKHKTS